MPAGLPVGLLGGPFPQAVGPAGRTPGSGGQPVQPGHLVGSVVCVILLITGLDIQILDPSGAQLRRLTLDPAKDYQPLN